MFTSDQRWQHPVFLFFASELHNCVEAENVHVHGGSTAHSSSRLSNGLHHHRGLRDTQAGSAVSFGNADTQPAIPGQRLMKLCRKSTALVFLQPVIRIETLADFQDGLANFAMLGRQVEALDEEALAETLPKRLSLTDP
ncbi:hypothetical protein D3C81_472550 [compost metagenome]